MTNTVLDGTSSKEVPVSYEDLPEGLYSVRQLIDGIKCSVERDGKCFKVSFDEPSIKKEDVSQIILYMNYMLVPAEFDRYEGYIVSSDGVYRKPNERFFKCKSIEEAKPMEQLQLIITNVVSDDNVIYRNSDMKHIASSSYYGNAWLKFQEGVYCDKNAVKVELDNIKRLRLQGLVLEELKGSYSESKKYVIRLWDNKVTRIRGYVLGKKGITKIITDIGMIKVPLTETQSGVLLSSRTSGQSGKRTKQLALPMAATVNTYDGKPVTINF